MNINEFAKKFDEEYCFLYEHQDRVPGVDEAIDEFDRLMEESEDFARQVREFAAWRRDAVASDRECAAYMFAWNDMATDIALA